MRPRRHERRRRRRRRDGARRIDREAVERHLKAKGRRRRAHAEHRRRRDAPQRGRAVERRRRRRGDPQRRVLSTLNIGGAVAGEAGAVRPEPDAERRVPQLGALLADGVAVDRRDRRQVDEAAAVDAEGGAAGARAAERRDRGQRGVIVSVLDGDIDEGVVVEGAQHSDLELDRERRGVGREPRQLLARDSRVRHLAFERIGSHVPLEPPFGHRAAVGELPHAPRILVAADVGRAPAIVSRAHLKLVGARAHLVRARAHLVAVLRSARLQPAPLDDDERAAGERAARRVEDGAPRARRLE